MNTIGQGLNTVGSNLGLGASIVGVSTAVSKGIAKSSMPPLQKTGAIVAAGVATGVSHAAITHINNYNNLPYTSDHNNTNSSINKFIDDSTTSTLSNLLFDIELLNYTCLYVIIILIIQVIFKLHLKDSIVLNLSNTLGINLNKSLEYYINKVITLNKKMSVI
jgi:hypothetical protein